MFAFDAVSSYLLVMALLTLLVAVLVWQRQRTQRTILVWLAAGVLGMLLGSIGSYAGVRVVGYELKLLRPALLGEEASVNVTMGPGGAPKGGPPDGGAAPGKGGMGKGGMGKGGMGKGGMGMGGMGKGGPPAPRPARDLATLVRKLELLTGDIAISLSAEQAAKLGECLKDVEKAESISDDEAKAKQEKVLAVLNESQKSRLQAVGLPRPGLPGEPPGSSGMGAPKQEEPGNPFRQESEAKALKSLRERLAPKGDGGKTPPK